MSEATFKKVKKRYKLTVDDGYLRFIAAMEGDKAVYDATIHQLDTLKTVDLSVDTSSKKIYASGKVYDITTNVRGGELSVDTVAVPAEIADKARGAVQVGAGAYDVNLPQAQEFAFAFQSNMSDGSKVYVLYPRCKLAYDSEQDKTSDDSDIDPSEQYKIEALPTAEGLWRIRYYTASVAEGKKPYTMAEFVAKGLYTKADVDAYFGAEPAAE